LDTVNVFNTGKRPQTSASRQCGNIKVLIIRRN